MDGRYVVDENGKRVAVLLNIQEYERMVEEPRPSGCRKLSDRE